MSEKTEQAIAAEAVETFADVLHGARMVEVNVDLDVMVVWYGRKSLMHVFQISTLEIMHAWTESELFFDALGRVNPKAADIAEKAAKQYIKDCFERRWDPYHTESHYQEA